MKYHLFMYSTLLTINKHVTVVEQDFCLTYPMLVIYNLSLPPGPDLKPTFPVYAVLTKRH